MKKNNALYDHLNNIISFPKAKEIYHQIRRQKNISKFDLIELTKMKSGTVTRLLTQLLEENLILEVGYGESTGGRRPILYQSNPEFGNVLGLNISRTSASLVLADLHLNIKEIKTWNLNANVDPFSFFDEVIESIQQILNKESKSSSVTLGLGIALFGPMDEAKRILIDPYGFSSPKWMNLNICDYFEKRLNLPVFLDNGACTALRGEYWADSQNQFSNIVYIHLGEGFRSAIMTNGKIMSGAIGQMIIQTDGIPPYNPYGNYGALHSYVIINYVVTKVKSYIKKGRKSLINNIEELTFQDLLIALEEKDPLVIEVFTQSATYLGIGLANLINILHPEKILLGGPLISKVENFYSTATETALNKSYGPSDSKIIFSKPKLGDEGMSLGAGAMVIDYMTNFNNESDYLLR